MNHHSTWGYPPRKRKKPRYGLYLTLIAGLILVTLFINDMPEWVI